jgi:uncharacterized protein YecE (DUF72 family)
MTKEELASMRPRGIRVGVAGWSYPDWRGTFYPRKRDSTPDLARVARHFDCAEINVAFYRPVESSMARRWLETVKDRPEFLFTSKVPKELTHGKIPPEAIGLGAQELKEGLAPLIEAGRLGAVLLQFPFYFRDRPESRDRIRRLVDALRPLPVVVEVRSRGFLFARRREEAGAAEDHLEEGPGSGLRFLSEIGAGLVNIDIPPGKWTIPPTAIATSSVGYVRLHGRNSRTWFDPRAGRDSRYDYLYSEEELRDWARRAEQVSSRTERTFVIANNHFRGQAPAAALLLLHFLGRPPPEPPPELLETYPELTRLLGRSAAPRQAEIPFGSEREESGRAAPAASRGGGAA